MLTCACVAITDLEARERQAETQAQEEAGNRRSLEEEVRDVVVSGSH